MIVVLAVGAAVASGAAVVGARAWLRARRSRRVAAAKLAEKPGTASDPFEQLGIKPGDVVMLREREIVTEAAWRFHEGSELVAALYFAGDEQLLLTAGPEPRAFLMQSTRAPSALELPASVEIEGQSFSRRGRRPTRLIRSTGAPEAPHETPLLAEYEAGAKEALWLVGRAGDWVAFCGEKIDAALLDNWGSGRG